MAYHSGAEHDPYGPRAYGPTGGPSRRSGGVPDGLIVGGLALAVSVTLLAWTSTGIAGWLAHGSWPEGVTFLRTAGAVRALLTAPSDVAGAWPASDPATLPGPTLLWTAFLAQLVVVFSSVLWVATRVARLRARRRTPRPRTGTADDAPAGPARAAAPFEPVGPGASITSPDGGPIATAAQLLDSPGGAVVEDPDGSVLARTARQRGKLGPVHVYDPGHLVDTPVRLRWAPHHGCTDAATAHRRARALLAPVRPSGPVFQLDAETAETLLRTYLHAAALTGQPFPQIHRWAQGRQSAEPAKILRTHPKAAPGMSMELEAALTSHPGRRDAGLALINRALTGLDQLHIRQTCSPGRVDALALDNLAGQDGTLYIVGDSDATAPFRLALLEAVTDRLTRVGTGR